MSDQYQTPIHLRPAVQWFAEQMELALRRNEYKGGWQNCTGHFLINRLRDEYLELHGAVFGGGNSEQTISEAADVANFAMMIADNARPFQPPIHGYIGHNG